MLLILTTNYVLRIDQVVVPLSICNRLVIVANYTGTDLSRLYPRVKVLPECCHGDRLRLIFITRM
jgi:hypothetical protein